MWTAAQRRMLRLRRLLPIPDVAEPQIGDPSRVSPHTGTVQGLLVVVSQPGHIDQDREERLLLLW